MNALVIYDSVFGNTERIARSIAAALGEDTVAQNVSAVTAADLNGIDILFVGSPTRGFKPTPAITAFLASLPADALKGVKAAAFDTRIPLDSIKNPIFRLIVKKGGYADRIIAKALAAKGAALAIPSDGFIVLASEGPLKEGERDRAAVWARSII
ncbi:MAG TPA: flavodoxin domain-containing protein [Anaerolineaceae bacterium]|nr:flavodoxin domain-containing protein [Anaerolineaceae bacterium]